MTYDFDKYFELESKIKGLLSEGKVTEAFKIKDEMKALEIPRKYINRIRISREKIRDLQIELLDDEVRKNPYMMNFIEDEIKKIRHYVEKMVEK